MAYVETSSGSNRIGYRRLFEAVGCSLAERVEAKWEFVVSEDFEAQIYLGPKPGYGVDIVSNSPKYLVPGKDVALGIFQVHHDATQTSYSGKFFLEVVVSCPASEGNASEEKDIVDGLLQQAEAKKAELQNVLDLVAGFFGLRFHRQFVLEPLNENAVVWRGERSTRSFCGPVWEVMEPVALTEFGVAKVESYRESLRAIPRESRRNLGWIFHWLLRSWRERDPVNQFMALFLPLEAVLNAAQVKRDPTQGKKVRAIRTLIRRHGGEEGEELGKLFNRAFERLAPTLDERFVELASAAKLPGWKKDIEAFRAFKRLRNALVHHGDISVKDRLAVGQDEVRTLSDLVERYVSYVLFGDEEVYQSKWRPQVSQEAEGEDV